VLLKGKVIKFGDNLDTDVILPSKYLNVTDVDELANHCMEGIKPKFSEKVKDGDIIFAGKNFGCGSSREHAVFAIKGIKVSAVVAESFARIFYRNAINNALPVLECPEAVNSTEDGDEVEINFEKGLIINKSKNVEFAIKKFPAFVQELILAGGLLQYIKKQSGIKERF